MPAIDDLTALLKEKIDPLEFYKDHAHDMALFLKKSFESGKNIGDVVDAVDFIEILGVCVFGPTTPEEDRKSLLEKQNLGEGMPEAGLVKGVSDGMCELTEASKEWYDKLSKYYETESKDDLTELALYLQQKFDDADKRFRAYAHHMAHLLHTEIHHCGTAVGERFVKYDEDEVLEQYMVQIGILTGSGFVYEITEAAKQWHDKLQVEGFYKDDEDITNVTEEISDDEVPF
ncbi:hypothetical protein KY346_06420 [Candidatus Woesearchaeota archaeon]|nr:hypothetical protein [Candidatus Woesearchaeota archaeon]